MKGKTNFRPCVGPCNTNQKPVWLGRAGDCLKLTTRRRVSNPEGCCGVSTRPTIIHHLVLSARPLKLAGQVHTGWYNSPRETELVNITTCSTVLEHKYPGNLWPNPRTSPFVYISSFTSCLTYRTERDHCSTPGPLSRPTRHTPPSVN